MHCLKLSLGKKSDREKKTTVKLIANLRWSIKKILGFNKFYFACLCINSILRGITPVVVLFIIQGVIEAIQYKVNGIKPLIATMILLSGFELVSQLFQIITQVKIENYELGFDVFFQEEVLKKVAALDCKDFEKSNTYDLINRTQYDANAGVLGSVKMVFSLLSAIISTISYVVIILKFSIIVFALIVIPPVLRYVVEKKCNLLEYEIEKQNTEPERKSSYIAYLVTNSECFKELKMYGLFDHLVYKYRLIRTVCNTKIVRVHNRRAKTYIALALFEAGIDFLVTVGILVQAFGDVISIGGFVLYCNSIDGLKENIVSVFTQLSFLYRNSAMIEQIRAFFNMKNEDIQNDGLKIENIDSIKLIGVSYKYQKQEEYVLEDINVEIKSGQTVVFMGHNGSGKSTLMKIIMGIYNDYQGTILVNDIDRKRIDIQSYRSKVGVLFQDYIKYETSISENIAYGNINMCSAEDVDKMLEKVCLEGLSNRKEKQLGYQFNEGLQLSMGQWQKIALARTLISNSDLYIFDEPNASIDLRSEKEILLLISPFIPQLLCLHDTEMLCILSSA